MATLLSVFKQKPKMLLLPEKGMELEYLESVSPGKRHEHVYMVTPFSLFKTKTKNGTFARKENGTTGLKLWHADT